MKKNDRHVGLKVAWHKLTDVVSIVTEDNAFPYEVKQYPLHWFDGTNWIPTNYRACVTGDNQEMIGEPFDPETYTVIDMHHEWKLVEKCLVGTHYTVVSAGTIHNRAQAFISFELTELKSIEAGGRKVDFLLNAFIDFRKSKSRTFVNSSIMPVCENTLNANLALAIPALTIPHRKNCEHRQKEVEAYLETCFGMPALFKAAMEGLAKVKADSTLATKLYSGLVTRKMEVPNLSTRAENTVATMTNLFERGLGNSGENMLDVLSGATEYYTRHSSGGEDMAKQFSSSENGSAAVTKGEFTRLLLDGNQRKALVKRGEIAMTNRERTLAQQDELEAKLISAPLMS